MKEPERRIDPTAFLRIDPPDSLSDLISYSDLNTLSGSERSRMQSFLEMGMHFGKRRREFIKKVQKLDGKALDLKAESTLSLGVIGLDINSSLVMAQIVKFCEDRRMPLLEARGRKLLDSTGFSTSFDGHPSLLEFMDNGDEVQNTAVSLALITSCIRERIRVLDEDKREEVESDPPKALMQSTIYNTLLHSSIDWSKAPLTVPVEGRDCIEKLIDTEKAVKSNILDQIMSGDPTPIKEEMEPYIDGDLTDYIATILGISVLGEFTVCYKTAQRLSHEALTQENRDFYKNLAVALHRFIDERKESHEFDILSVDEIGQVLDVEALDGESEEEFAPRNLANVLSEIRSLSKKQGFLAIKDLSKIDFGKFQIPQTVTFDVEQAPPYRVNILFGWIKEDGSRMRVMSFVMPEEDRMDWDLLEDIDSENVKPIRDAFRALSYKTILYLRDELAPDTVDADNIGAQEGRVKVTASASEKNKKRKQSKAATVNPSPMVKDVEQTIQQVKTHINIPSKEDLAKMLRGLSSVDKERVVARLNEVNMGRSSINRTQVKGVSVPFVRAGKVRVTLVAGERGEYSIASAVYAKDVRKH